MKIVSDILAQPRGKLFINAHQIFIDGVAGLKHWSVFDSECPAFLRKFCGYSFIYDLRKPSAPAFLRRKVGFKLHLSQVTL